MDLDPSIIERCRWKRTPNRAITAPEPQLQFDHTHEDMRLAQFEQSRMTRNGVVAPFKKPENHYE